MRKPDTILDEIHETRRKIYEEIKDMTAEERAERVNRIGEAAALKYGFRIYTNISGTEREQAMV